MTTPKGAVLVCALIAAFAVNQVSVASGAGRAFDEADAALNIAYQALLSSIHDPHERERLVEAQKAWIKCRDENVAFYYARYPASKGGLFFKMRLTKERTAFLKSVLAMPNSDDNVLGPAF